MLQLQGLTKSYPTPAGRKYVFRDLDLTFPTGANIGLIGRNGAGKSTLLRLLGGIDSPDRGRVHTDARISFPVGLGGGFSQALSARDNVAFVCRVHGSFGADLAARVRAVEAFADIGEYFDLPVGSYSSGMRSRVAFGLSMAFDFDYYLIDEVMAVGDAQFREKSRSTLLERLARAQVILTSHNMSDIRQFCNVVVLLERGRVRVFDDIEAGIKAYQAAPAA